MTDDYRLKQSRDQAKAIEDRSKTKVTRAGDRDSEYGYQNFINPDGSQSRAGLKTYNAEIPSGTPVLAAPRSDGLTALQSLKADPSSKVVPKIFGQPPDREKIDAWALADTYGIPGSEDADTFYTYLINLISGVTYLVGTRPAQHPGCFGEPGETFPDDCETVYYGDNYEAIIVCTPRPPGPDGPIQPFANSDNNSLSLDTYGRPVVRFRHTVTCPANRNLPYDFENMTIDKYIRLSGNFLTENTGGTNGANLIGDWRYDASSFAGKGLHYDDPFTSLVEPGRTTRYIITSDIGSIVNNAEPIEIRYLMVGMANNTPLSAELQIFAVYRGVSTPANLNIVSVAIRKYR